MGRDGTRYHSSYRLNDLSSGGVQCQSARRRPCSRNTCSSRAPCPRRRGCRSSNNWRKESVAWKRLAEKTGLTLANCSQHLQQLRRAGLVTSRRDGKAVIYRLTDAKTLDADGPLARRRRTEPGAGRAYPARPFGRRGCPRTGQPRRPGDADRGGFGDRSRRPPCGRIRCRPHSGRAQHDTWRRSIGSSQARGRPPKSSPIAGGPIASMPTRRSPPCASTASMHGGSRADCRNGERMGDRCSSTRTERSGPTSSAELISDDRAVAQHLRDRRALRQQHQTLGRPCLNSRL